MASDFRKWLLEKLSGGSQRVSSAEVFSDSFFDLSSEVYVRELAFWQAVNLIASALSKCEFRTYEDGKEIKKAEYFRWNYAPNKNQSSSVFLHKLIAKLYSENEVLVVDTRNGQLLVADSYAHHEYALVDDVFTQVTVGEYRFDKSFRQKDVMYLRLHERQMRPLVNGLFEAYQKLIAYGMKAYRQSRGTKGVLTIDTMASGNKQTLAAYEEIRNNGFKKFAEAENAVMPLWKGMSYEELGSKTYANDSTRDIRSMIDDVAVFTARAFGIPPALMSGEVQGVSDALDQFLTFCIDPLADLLTEEINRKIYGERVLSGSFIRIDTSSIQHVDLLRVAESVDKLISSGAFSINDVRRLAGEPPIDEDWANQHFITKNYSDIEAPIQTSKGGE